MKDRILRQMVMGCLLFAFAGCEKEEVNLSHFKGTWVESLTLSDTIIVSDESLFSLNRGKEITQDGFLLPKAGSGLYFYKIDKDQIRVNNTISSCFCPNDFIFELEKNRFTIGNFYAPTGQAVLVFKRIK